jgi:hypothetical protein
MKLVMLVDSSRSGFEEMADLVDPTSTCLIDTTNCDATLEYGHLRSSVREFSQSDKELMLINFSGKESILKELGDECSEMILSISYDKNSKYYTECPIEMFLKLLDIFKKETNTNGIGIEKSTA